MAASVRILYSTETGAAEEVAYSLLKSCKAATEKGVSKISSPITVHNINSDFCDVNQLVGLTQSTSDSAVSSTSLCVFVVSTTGEGDVPTSMLSFWKSLLSRNLNNNALSTLHFCIFGLGDSSYEKFNAAARRLRMRFLQLGAHEVLPIGLGDDQDPYGYLTALDPWTQSLLAWVRGSLSSDISSSAMDCVESSPLAQGDSESVFCFTGGKDDVYSVIKRLGTSTSDNKRDEDIHKPPSGTRLFIGSIVENTRCTAMDWDQDVRNIKIELGTGERMNDLSDGITSRSNISINNDRSSSGSSSSSSISGSVCLPLYLAGDVAVVYPRNPDSWVSRAFAVMAGKHGDLSIDTVVSIGLKNPQMHRSHSRIGSVNDCSVYNLLHRYLDILAIPQRGFFERIADYATSDEEKEKLLEISSMQGNDIYFDYCVREKRNFIEILEDFKSCRPPLSVLLECIPKMRPRHYSIASSGFSTPTQVELCVALVKHTTRYRRVIEGVCSSYLGRCSVGDEVSIGLRRGLFRDPIFAGLDGGRADSVDASTESTPNRNIPLILVGPGTGVAPMRALLLDRYYQINRSRLTEESITRVNASGDNSGDDSSKIGETFMFFGCRKQSKDFLYQSEWENLLQKGRAKSGLLSAGGDHFYSEKLSSSIICAFSRDKAEKVYVTDKILQHGAEVVELLHKGAYVFVSGSAKNMPRDVREAFVKTLVQFDGFARLDAEKYIQLMERRRQYVVEAWS